MLLTLFLFLAGVGTTLFIAAMVIRRISLLAASLVFNLANLMSPWTVVYPSGYTETVVDSNTTYFVYDFSYLDFTTKVVLSMIFLAFVIITTLQFWNVVSSDVAKSIESGREVDRL